VCARCPFERMFELSAQLPRRNEINRTRNRALAGGSSVGYALAHIVTIYIYMYKHIVDVSGQLDTFSATGGRSAVNFALVTRNVP